MCPTQTLTPPSSPSPPCHHAHPAPAIGNPKDNSGDVWPSNLLEAITQTIEMPCIEPTRPDFHVDMSTKAAHKNFYILCKHDFDLASAIKSQKDSPVGYGSEFRPVSTLDQVFHGHPNWQWMLSIIQDGSNWPLQPLAFEKRATDLKQVLTFGNHKGATT